MNHALVYHTLIHAMAGTASVSAIQRFAMAAQSAINGHIPQEQAYLVADQRRCREKNPASIEQSVVDWLETDINPAVQTIRCLTNSGNALFAYKTYRNADVLADDFSSSIGRYLDSTLQQVPCDRSPASPIGLDGVETSNHELAGLEVNQDEPALLRLSTFAVLEALMNNVEKSAIAGTAIAPHRLSDIARHLGVESSASAEAAVVFECENPLTISDLAKKLGCGQRTLERYLKAEGTTPELLRSSTRITKAMGAFRTDDSLTNIALDVGFSDLAHMSRAFKASCGMSPSVVRQCYRGGVVPEQ